MICSTAANYKGIKLISSAVKIWERVIQARLCMRREEQFGVMAGRNIIEILYIML